jgi:hypothetical protein
MRCVYRSEIASFGHEKRKSGVNNHAQPDGDYISFTDMLSSLGSLSIRIASSLEFFKIEGVHFPGLLPNLQIIRPAPLPLRHEVAFLDEFLQA